tara:strand:+ start:78 stop:470 length:393 start_codon:yes stop_codon:yes gene_type:complete
VKLDEKRNPETMTTVYSPMQQVFETDELAELINRHKTEQETIDAAEAEAMIQAEINKKKELCKKIYPKWEDIWGLTLWPENKFNTGKMKTNAWKIRLNGNVCFVMVWRRAQNNALTYDRVRGVIGGRATN